jgi:hypothetical protein
MYLTRSLRTAAAAVVLAATPLALDAQGVGTSPTAPAQRKAVVSLQPISVLLGIYAGEVETVIGRTTTFGVGINFWDGWELDESDDDFQYLSAEGKLRYYPGGRPLEGFSFGVTGGFASARADVNDCFGVDCDDRRDRASGAKIGFELDYNWLLGVDRRFAVSIGAGAKRIVVSDLPDLPVAYPTVRLSVGYAF